MSAAASAHDVPASAGTPRPQEVLHVLRDLRLVLAGVTEPGGAGHAVARRALLDGAHVTLVAPPGELARCRRLAAGLPRGAHVVCADLAREEDVAALHEHLRCAYGTVDGALHAAPARRPEAGRPSPLTALARAVTPLLPPGGGSIVALVPHGRAARAPGLEDGVKRLARQLAPAGGRANLVAGGGAGPAEVARAICFLLSPLGQGVTGRSLHVDRRTSDRPGVGSPAGALVRRMAAGPQLAHTSITPSHPAAPAATDQRGASR